MKRKIAFFIQDIIKVIELIEEYTQDISENEFLESQLLIDAVVRNLEVIGEASKFVPEK